MKKVLLTFIILLTALTIKAQIPVNIVPPKPLSIDELTKTDSVFSWVEKIPEPIGGQLKFQEFIKKELRWPNDAMDFQGKVILSVVVERNGDLTDIKVIKGLSPTIDKEAVRLLNKSPKWNPGSIHSIPVRAKYFLAVPFLVNK